MNDKKMKGEECCCCCHDHHEHKDWEHKDWGNMDWLNDLDKETLLKKKAKFEAILKEINKKLK